MPARLEVYSDLHCPYAYLASYRLRQVLPEFEDRVEVIHRSLAIEYVDEKVTPFDILNAETPIILLEAPDIPYEPWHAPMDQWPSTMLPAFEAVKVAERQGWKLAHELDWRLRVAFWRHSRCIAMRHVIRDEARQVEGLDVRRFLEEWDHGVAKAQVIGEAREGWDKLQLEVSPTFVLPDGTRHANPASPKVKLDEGQHMKVVGIEPPKEKDWRAFYRGMLEAAARRA